MDALHNIKMRGGRQKAIRNWRTKKGRLKAAFCANFIVESYRFIEM